MADNGGDNVSNWRIKWFDRVDVNGTAQEAYNAYGYSTSFWLTDPPFSVMLDSLEWSAPPFNPINERIPLRPGSYLKYMDVEENNVQLMMLIKARTKEELYNIVAGAATNGVSLPNLFNPHKADIRFGTEIYGRVLTGFGKLLVHNPGVMDADGTPIQRELICRCISGFDIDMLNPLVKDAFCPLTFYANSPFWRDPRANVIESIRNDIDSSNVVWFGPIDGLPIGSSTATFQKKFFVDNLGEVPSPPFFTVKGPACAPWFKNLTTGKVFSFSTGCVIGAGQSMDINFENRTAILSGVGPQFQYIKSDSQFWDVMTFRNNIEVRLFDAPPGAPGGNPVNSKTDIRFYFHKRYSGVY